MPITGPIPDWLFAIVAAATVFIIMFDLGLAIVPAELRWVSKRPGLIARALFSALVAVPALECLVARTFELPRAAEIGIVLMAISPGAPVALRRSLGAGGHRSFAPALQIAVAALAIVSMPLSVAVFNDYFAGHAEISPLPLARQVFVAQLLPLSLGMVARRFFTAQAEWAEPKLARLGGILLVVLLILALIDIGEVVLGAGVRVTLAIVIVTSLALAVGHLMGGPEPATRTATAISGAARNPGLALLVATLNGTPPAITATVLAYLVIAALTLIPYIAWRRRTGATAAPIPDPPSR
jgi:BASS family bile acid:Na+ symporter